MNVCCAKAKLSSASFEEDVWAVRFCKLVCDNLGAIRASVIDNDELPVEIPVVRQSV